MHRYVYRGNSLEVSPALPSQAIMYACMTHTHTDMLNLPIQLIGIAGTGQDRITHRTDALYQSNESMNTMLHNKCLFNWLTDPELLSSRPGPTTANTSDYYVLPAAQPTAPSQSIPTVFMTSSSVTRQYQTNGHSANYTVFFNRVATNPIHFAGVLNQTVCVIKLKLKCISFQPGFNGSLVLLTVSATNKTRF